MSVTMINPVNPTPQAEQPGIGPSMKRCRARAPHAGAAGGEDRREIRAAFRHRAGGPAAERLRGAGLQPAGRVDAGRVQGVADGDAERIARRGAQRRRRHHLEDWRSRPKVSRAANGGRAFNDTRLDGLIAQATASNQNLTVAAARVKEARAIAGIAEADRIPQIGVGVGAQRGQLSPLEAGVAPGTRMSPATSYKASLSASYELDLFGRVSSNVAAARGDAAASEATYRSVLLSLQADVAQTYFRLRALDAEIATVNQTVRLREESVRVTGRRFELGDIGEFDLSRAKTELATARAEAIGLQRQRANASMRWPCCWASRPRTSAPPATRWKRPRACR